MALSGLHVECGYAGGPGIKQLDVPTDAKLLWSQTLALNGTTTTPVPAADRKLGSPILSLRASVDLIFVLGMNPNPATGAGRFLRAGQGIEVFPRQGELLACAAANLASGVFITCGYAAGLGFDGNYQILLAEAVWSQQMAIAGIAASVMPSKSHNRGNPVISISTAAASEIYYSFDLPGLVNAGVNPRRYLGPGEDTDVFVEPGQKIAWTAA